MNEERRLESWKEIGTYLQRDLRTARRWEKEEGLPVHRHSHKSRSSVYAYPSEIEAWRVSRKVVAEAAPAPARTVWRVPAFAVMVLLCLVMVGNGVRPAAAQGANPAARQIWSGEGVDNSGSPTPDGRYLSFTDWTTGDLAVRDLTSGTQRRLTKQASAYEDGYANRSVVSPDGKQVAFTWKRKGGAELRLVGLDGSGLRVMYSNPEDSYLEPGGFSADGKSILTVLNASNEADKIAMVPVAGGAAQILKTLTWGSLGRVSLAPDGRSIAYDFAPQAGAPGRKIMLLAWDGSRETTLRESAAREEVFGWTRDGKTLLFASDRTGSRELMGMTVVDGKAQGEPERLRRDIGTIRPVGMTNAGALLYSESNLTNDVMIAAWDWETGKMAAAPKPAGHRLLGVNRDPAWSPDGKELAYVSQSGDRGSEVLTILNTGSGAERQLSPKLSLIQRLTGWSPDGRWLLLMAFDEKKREGAYGVDVRTGEVRALAQAQSAQDIFWPEWLPNGKAIVFYRRDEAAPASHLIIHEIESGAERELKSGAENAGYIYTALSPDGRYLAFRTGGGNEKLMLEVVAVAGGEPRVLFRTDDPNGRVDLLGWTPDSRHVIFGSARRVGLRSVDRKLWRIPVEGGEPRQLESGGIVGGPIRLHPDGRQIAFTAAQGGSEIWALENFLPKAWPAK